MILLYLINATVSTKKLTVCFLDFQKKVWHGRTITADTCGSAGQAMNKITDPRNVEFLRKLNAANERGRAADRKTPLLKWAIVIKPTKKEGA